MNDHEIIFELLKLSQSQHVQVDRIQNYFCIVTVTIIGLTIGSDKATRSFKEALLIVLGYLIFCFSNITILLIGHMQLAEFISSAQELIFYNNLKLTIYSPPSILKILCFYQSMASTVCICLLTLTFFKNRKK